MRNFSKQEQRGFFFFQESKNEYLYIHKDKKVYLTFNNIFITSSIVNLFNSHQCLGKQVGRI